MNNVEYIGNVGAEPQVKYTQNGECYARFTVATSEQYIDRNGEKKQITDWHTVSCFGKLAEAVGNTLHKGMKVYVHGKHKKTSYERNGQKTYFEYTAADFVGTSIMNGMNQNGNGGNAQGNGFNSQNNNGFNTNDNGFGQFGPSRHDEEIPF